MKKAIKGILLMSLFVFILFGCSANQTAGNISDHEWEGSYTIEKMGTSYLVELIFTDPKIEVTGVYGTRKYDDGSTIPSLILTTENEVLSFLDNE